MPGPSRIVSWSERCYSLLLRAYPEDFRRRHGREMYQTFRDCCRDELCMGGNTGLLRFWGLVLGDFLLTVPIERISQLKKFLGLTKEPAMVNTPFRLHVAQHTDIGIKRATNEDAMLVYVPEDTTELAQKGALFVVADGLGGHNKGDEASRLAVNTIREAYYQKAGGTDTEIIDALVKAFQLASKRILEVSLADPATKKGMGTTAVAVVIHEQTAYIANAGDSLVYLIREGQVSQLADNHAWGVQMLRQGKITEEEARTQNQNVIIRCLGELADVEISTSSIPVQKDDILVLCTDGLHGLISEDEIRATVERYEPEESTQHLIALANERGGPDNITAMVVRVV